MTQTNFYWKFLIKEFDDKLNNEEAVEYFIHDYKRWTDSSSCASQSIKQLASLYEATDSNDAHICRLNVK